MERSLNKIAVSLIVFCALVTTSCVEKRTNSTSTGNTNQSTTTNTTGSDGSNGSNGTTGTDGSSGTNGSGGGYDYNHPDCRTGSPPGISDGGQNIEYYKINNPKLSAHGTANPNRYASYYPNGIVWSSLNDLDNSISQNIFRTNSRFHIRIKALPGPQYENDSKGIYCSYVAEDYKKLQVGVVVRKQSATSGDYYLFNDINTGEFSDVHSFVVPPNTTEPLVIEIRDIGWDRTCSYYTDQGFPNVQGACPYAPVWDTACVAWEIQVATDDTKDFPCPKAY
ncbi:MAG: hypothetical protein KC493_10330 [Bacteriovoracaceae bacterium]|nr:hypothetical protein [Bacteriovoracaceae bacterium]